MRELWRLFWLTTFLDWALKLTADDDEPRALIAMAGAQLHFIKRWQALSDLKRKRNV